MRTTLKSPTVRSVTRLQVAEHRRVISTPEADALYRLTALGHGSPETIMYRPLFEEGPSLSLGSHGSPPHSDCAVGAFTGPLASARNKANNSAFLPSMDWDVANRCNSRYASPSCRNSLFSSSTKRKKCLVVPCMAMDGLGWAKCKMIGSSRRFASSLASRRIVLRFTVLLPSSSALRAAQGAPICPALLLLAAALQESPVPRLHVRLRDCPRWSPRRIGQRQPRCRRSVAG